MNGTAQARTPMHIGTLTPIRGVPVLPPADDPRHRFPVHAGYLQEHLAGLGEDPTRWAVLEAVESRLDEQGMEVRFNLLRRAPARKLLFLWVTVDGGRLVAVSDRPGAA